VGNGLQYIMNLGKFKEPEKNVANYGNVKGGVLL
jgi:hypothetical protein